jgi:DNA polymerase III sliding clamp (beta) subunit (PCNA family)
MKFTVAKKDLEAALQLVSQTVGSSGSGSDISNHYLFRIQEVGDQKRVEILSSNGRVFSSAFLVCQIEDETHESFTIEAKRLKGNNGWLSAVSDSALTFERLEDLVVASSPRGSIKFQTLDPSTFPYWDKTLENIKKVATFKADRLKKILDYVRNMISDDESRKPHLCVTEVMDGSYYATNMNVATMVKVPGLEKSTMRIHGKDVRSVVGFLNACGENEVEVYEHNRVVIFKCDDGSLFGETRFNVNFPNLSLSKYTSDQYAWTLPKQEIVEGIKFLMPCTDIKDAPHVFFAPGDDNNVILSMVSTSKQKVSLPIPCSKFSEERYEGDEFCVTHPELLKVLDYHDEEEVVFGINKRPKGKKGGFLRLTREDEETGDQYLTVVTWVVT